MTLNLDSTQRLNLVAILKSMEVVGRFEVWKTCQLANSIDLNDQEREAIGWRKVKVADNKEYVVWDTTIQPLEYRLETDDIERICKAVDIARIVPARDLFWYDPLVAQLPPPKESANGHH